MRTIVAIGGGEIKNKTTLEIDKYIASLAVARAGDRRANALFVGTASHDYLPYYNSFRKTYTSVLGLKCDVALTVYKKTEAEKLREKFDAADLIYVGGGDTLFMLASWKESGILPLIREAYERGVILAGLSAGAICWFERIYTDSGGEGGPSYKMADGLGWLKGAACPHFNLRKDEFERDFDENKAFCIEDNCAVVFRGEEKVAAVSCGGQAFVCQRDINKQIKIQYNSI